MGLVDYSDSDDDDDAQPGEQPVVDEEAASARLPPPLPRAFHDLYASNVRTSPTDDPGLHQGRTRATPHVAGRWPSHLYIEWFPSPSQQARLAALLASADAAVSERDGLHSLLVSDLGAPLPLHISLSRPFVLPTAARAAFLGGVEAAVTHGRVAPFDVAFSGLDWHRSPDASRAFLVLRARTDDSESSNNINRPLLALLARCNAEVTTAGQPALYGGGSVADTAHAFHVSLAWTLSEQAAIDGWAEPTKRAWTAWQAADPANRALTFRVDSVKAKIGNVVTDIPLAGPRPTASGLGLFGL